MKKGLLVCLGMLLLVNCYPVLGNDAPIIEISANFTNSSIIQGEERVFYVIASDVDEDNLTYFWVVDNIYVVGEEKNIFAYVGREPGNHIIRVEVSDGKIGIEESWMVNVIDEDYEVAEIIEEGRVEGWYWKVLGLLLIVAIIIGIFILVSWLRKKHLEQVEKEQEKVEEEIEK